MFHGQSSTIILGKYHTRRGFPNSVEYFFVELWSHFRPESHIEILLLGLFSSSNRPFHLDTFNNTVSGVSSGLRGWDAYISDWTYAEAFSDLAWFKSFSSIAFKKESILQCERFFFHKMFQHAHKLYTKVAVPQIFRLYLSFLFYFILVHTLRSTTN